MSKKKKSESNFLVQGSILAVASIISRIIGLLYRIPLKSIIGDIGNDYYGTAMEIYSILLLISSYSLPLAVSKLVSTRMAKGQRKNAYRIFKGALIFALVSGTAAGLIVFFGAGVITTYIVRTPLSIFALQVLAPTLLVVAVLGVIRGFFQGMGTMMPSAVSQLIEQIINAVISVWTAYMLYQYGTRIGAVLGNPATYAEAYGAAGGTIGTGAGAVAALLFTLFVLAAYRPRFRKMAQKDKGKKTESYGAIFRILIMTIIPVLLSTTIYNITSFLDMGVFKHIAALQGYQAKDFSTMWGVYVGEYKVLVNVPIAIASSISASSVPSISTAFAAKDISHVKRKVAYSIRFIMVIAIPCAVGMGVLASPILQLLFQDDRVMTARMMQIGAVTIVFYSLSTLSNGILQGINRMNVPVKNAVIALVLHIGVLAALMYGLDLNIYAVVWANMFFSFLMCILNGMAIRKYLKYRQEIMRTFVIPSLAAAVMGLAVYGIYYFLMKTVKINAVSTGIAITAGVCVYGILLLLMRGLKENELRSFPMGNLIIKIAKKLHLM
ncbi:MAG: polysaccharide biosynthesis protein [Lachnospiraceae bacterium]|nr:polysaccharide biosynthesis protein [Lachnospiraceae bacterium]